MSHHYSGLNIGFPRGDARLDLTDLYAFPQPGDPGKSIFIMNVHPSVGLNPPGPTTAEPFAPKARYELKIDTNGDAVANISYEVRFSSLEGGEQSATLRRVEGAQAPETGAAWKVVRGLRRARRALAPEGTMRHWLFRKLLGAARVLRREGLGGVLKRTFRKLKRRK